MAHQKPPAATRLIERPGEGDVLLVPESRLSVVRGADTGIELKLSDEPVMVGSDRDCHLTLSDSAVSARHFSIAPTPEGFLLRDLQSTNGTFVEGLRAGEVYLPASATIAAGDTELRFVATGAELEVPLSKRTRFGGLLGHSQAMRKVFHILERVAKTDATVLLEGESGTGKEVAAEALHAESRSEGSFVAVDCGSIPPALIESELFGHVKGAFTGAVADRTGPFEEAGDGTVFLDEIGELPIDLQPKLLRALESRAVRRVGETNPRPFSARLVAATNRNLQHEVAAGRFRQDLYFRLSVIRLWLPPLRERREEIPRLVSHFLLQLGHDPSDRPPESMMRMLCSHSWPGNVRELRNVVERLALLPGMSEEFYLQGAGEDGAGATAPSAASHDGEPDLELAFHEAKRRCVDRFEREYLARHLDRCQGNISELARAIGLSRQSCHRLLARHDLT